MYWIRRRDQELIQRFLVVQRVPWFRRMGAACGDFGSSLNSGSSTMDITTSLSLVEAIAKSFADKLMDAATVTSSSCVRIRERLSAGTLQRELANDSEVRRSGARSDRPRAVVGVVRLDGKLCDSW